MDKYKIMKVLLSKDLRSIRVILSILGNDLTKLGLENDHLLELASTSPEIYPHAVNAYLKNNGSYTIKDEVLFIYYKDISIGMLTCCGLEHAPFGDKLEDLYDYFCSRMIKGLDESLYLNFRHKLKEEYLSNYNQT